MRALAGSDFLDLWERGERLHPLDQALLALGRVVPEASYQALADWPLGRRNAALAQLRCSSFGRELEAWTACERCSEPLEFELDAESFLTQDHADSGEAIVHHGGRSFRPPTSRDLANIIEELDAETAALRLMQECRVDSEDSWSPSKEEIEQIGDGMALADPMAEIRIGLSCPECGHEWQESLDLNAFIWTEIEARARRLLLDIHDLASAYGWTESEILSLSESRRALYLDMVRK